MLSISIHYFSIFERSQRCAGLQVRNNRKAGIVAAQFDQLDRPTQSIGSLITPLAALAGFAAISTDVNWASSLHILQPLDLAAHTAVVSDIPSDVRLILGRILLSDVPIALGTIAQVVSLVRLLRDDPKTGLVTLACVTAMLWTVGNVIVLSDAPLTGFLKASFHRIRPDASTDSFSFPSGHATSASYVLATAIFLLLPKAFPPSTSNTSNPPPPQWLQNVADLCHNETRAVWLYAGLTATTCIGRVVGDRHWCSDVMAGWLLGLVVASVAVAAEGWAQNAIAANGEQERQEL